MGINNTSKKYAILVFVAFALAVLIYWKGGGREAIIFSCLALVNIISRMFVEKYGNG